jgi:demethylmenaquinone methyltransferase/2-methoxy-6-polyprenyl-1,4-benzoquinol methylase
MSVRVPGTEPGAGYVREMFARVAPRYDLLNHLLSFNVDRLWRRAVARRFQDVLSRPESRVLDLCCGTGDLALALERRGPARIIASDFCHPMLVRAAGKQVPYLAEADALALPFADATFDLLTVAFGFRNLADYDAGLREMLRLLRPGGQAGILEFSEPPGALFGPLYRFYFRHVLPRLGGAISGDPGAYTYLPSSVGRFPSPEELSQRMREAGFQNVEWTRLTYGVACLHVGTKN